MWIERGLISKSTVIDSFRMLWNSAGYHSSNFHLSQSSPLPPILCRYLAFGLGTTRDWTVADNSTKSMFGVSVNTKSILADPIALTLLCSELDKSLLDSLAISEYAFSHKASSFCEKLNDALTLLSNVQAVHSVDILYPLKNFLTALIFLEETEMPKRPIVSSSFPELPFAAFFSNNAFSQIPPSGDCKQSTTYAIAENLFHEAIHQQVNMTILLGSVFSDDYDAATAPRISVPWRNSYWELDRAFHAIVVYFGVIALRRMAMPVLDHETRVRIEAATNDAVQVHDYLVNEIERFGHYLTPEGREIVLEFSRVS